MAETSIVTKEKVQDIHYKNVMEEMTSLVRARVPIIWVVTHEEARFIDEFSETVASDCKRKTFVWSGYQGFVRPKDYKKAERASGTMVETWIPAKALTTVGSLPPDQETPGFVFIMRDFHAVLQEPIIRQLRDMYDFLSENGKTMIIVSPVLGYGPDGKNGGLPPALEKQVVVVNYVLPTREQIEVRVRELIDHLKAANKGNKTKLEYTDEEYLAISRALQGLTISEVDNSVATCLAHLKQLNPERLIQDKRQIVRKSQILEFVDTAVGLKDVGGLDNAKEFLGRYSKAYTKEAEQFGVEPLKGILLTGVPGTGKSLFSKAMGHMWKVPLLRLDVGKVMNGLVGGSEQRMRDVIGTAEAMAPCVLWIDEVEKSLSGTKSSNFSDGGTLARVFGTLLTAMQDGMKGVTIIATANDITALPPEFIRRFNEVFFVDLPGPDERWEIFRIHVAKRGRDFKSFEAAKKDLLAVSENFTGAEIEKAVKDGIARAFYADEKELKPVHVLESLKETKPIHIVYAEKIKATQDWASKHARYASSYSEQKLKKQLEAKVQKKVDVDTALSDMPELKKGQKPKAAPAGDGAGRLNDLDD